MTLDQSREWWRSARAEAVKFIGVCDELDQLYEAGDHDGARELLRTLAERAGQISGDVNLAQRRIDNPGVHRATG